MFGEKKDNIKEINNEEKIYSHNQLLLYICIILIINLLLMIVWIFTRVDDTDFSEHFTFAATVTSIILSVLAIFMSVTGEVKTQAIRDKIERETDEIIEVSDSVEGKIAELSYKMDAVLQNTDSIRTAVNKDQDIPQISNGVNNQKIHN